MEEIVKILKEFSKEEIELLERSDRQYKALERLYGCFKGREGEFLKLVCANALMSYQLQMKGEDYWEAFSRFFCGEWKRTGDLEEFLSLYNRRFLSSKLKRLKRVLNCVEKVEVEKVSSAFELAKTLAECLGQKVSSKTVVFAVKMVNYAFKIVYGKELAELDRVAIPVDSRIGKISTDLEFWKRISEKVGIPQIKLDAVFWISQNEENLKGLPPSLREKLRKVKGIIKI